MRTIAYKLWCGEGKERDCADSERHNPFLMFWGGILNPSALYSEKPGNVNNFYFWIFCLIRKITMLRRITLVTLSP